MPRRDDLKKIMIIGSGPIVIGQACEFDYSGTQGCKALREDGYEVVLVNSNPATIMTDPEFGDRTYIEPLTVECVAPIIEKERPDALLPTLGGQTGLNLSMDLWKAGVLQKFNVEMIGADHEAIHRAESREEFRRTMEKIGAKVPRSHIARNFNEAMHAVNEIGYPVIIRPAFTLGGTGGGTAFNEEEYIEMVRRGLRLSPVSEVLIEQSVLGWKEFELEVMRDTADNVVIICSIENVDAMGIHTGDSITVAPIQTLTDREYQAMRDEAIKIIRAIGVDTGGSNIQFAVNPQNGERVVIEMNPRVSRSSALASKATGFPIAKIAAKLAVGYRLDELPNDITQKTPACFEPTIDYCVVKIPRFAFEKFPGSDERLGIQMKSVGETMAIGKTFKEALQKGLRSLEVGRAGILWDGKDKDYTQRNVANLLKSPIPSRLFAVCHALTPQKYGGEGMTVEQVNEFTFIDPWFLENIRDIIECAIEAKEHLHKLLDREIGDVSQETRDLLRRLKRNGFSDMQLAYLLKPTDPDITDKEIAALRNHLDVHPVFNCVDTCAGEFEAYTPYYYSTYETRNETGTSDRKKIMILGGGPNRIGQGIEFDYCCVHSVFALREDHYETIMVNSNPETVSTDYDTSDRLYFEPVTVEDVMEIVRNEKPDGIIVQFGGQTPLSIALRLEEAIRTDPSIDEKITKIIGTSPENIDLAEDRDRFGVMMEKLKIPMPPNGTGMTFEQVKSKVEVIGYPVLIRPSYVLGGRAMEIVYDEASLEEMVGRAFDVSPDHPVLIDKFLEDATEVDVDALADGETVVIAAIMEHIEEAGIHSGDSACVIPPRTIPEHLMDVIRDYTRRIGLALDVRGLMNIQFAIKDDIVYVLEVNPRASRTVPFVSKSIGVPLAKIAARIMTGKTLKEIGFTKEIRPSYYTVKEAVLPFAKFYGCDVILGPEMRSTGEVMGIDRHYGMAFAKSQIAAGTPLPSEGTVFFSLNRHDQEKFIPIAKEFQALGFNFVATEGTAKKLNDNGIPARKVFKVNEGSPNVVDEMINQQIQLVINTFTGKTSRYDQNSIRTNAIGRNVPLLTTLAAARAAVEGIKAMREESINVCALQDYHKEVQAENQP
ncbi:carbamoyl-phosphate synthase large subunit [Candidatus Sumerlaeota bacterium]|nr:carbamoyl-phosphate synthase large subunit [Candidatus Sumerlaeota bacterium]